MTTHKGSAGDNELGRSLYRKLIGPLSTDTAADRFAGLDLDNRGNRISLERIAGRGGEDGRAARALLDEWAARNSDDAGGDRKFTSGRRRRGADPFDGPPAA
jgi:hypothetical protein